MFEGKSCSLFRAFTSFALKCAHLPSIMHSGGVSLRKHGSRSAFQHWMVVNWRQYERKMCVTSRLKRCPGSCHA
jgi:hypothetical protein